MVTTGVGRRAEIASADQPLGLVWPSLREPPNGLLDARLLVAKAAAMIASRAARRQHFAECDRLFRQPAWDVLLDLFVQAGLGRQVSVSAACIAADVPISTALRHIVQLERAGLVERENDEMDGRRSWLRLTAGGNARMAAFIGGA